LGTRRIALAATAPARYPNVAIEALLDQADEALVVPDRDTARAALDRADPLIRGELPYGVMPMGFLVHDRLVDQAVGDGGRSDFASLFFEAESCHPGLVERDS
jgi:hypothetical protein